MEPTNVKNVIRCIYMVTWLFDEDSLEVVFLDPKQRYNYKLFVCTATNFSIKYNNPNNTTIRTCCFIGAMLQNYQHLLDF